MKSLVPLILLLIMFSACPKPNSSADTFNGQWQMESYIAFLPERPVINEGDIVWTFKSADHTLKIENKLESAYPFIKKTGTYNYTISDGPKITIDGRTFDYRFEGNKLTLSDKPELDGPMIEFKKIE